MGRVSIGFFYVGQDVLGEDGECYAGVFSEVIMHPDEVKGGGDKDDGVGALHSRF